ncbi:ATP-binding protein [Acaryochloris marina]|uniref:trifunctional serine/threonine-protein kinase/ATP-binding protein/sensor histidine kinase n=1 Tax=Acaryochloris marina TaxID=155978 RepID=UPI001BAFCEAA|nr:ATP-binding protein [Acaryochloris marina]QUY44334.1 GAF domain-containing protein [Acaryochloris marina S15]
MASNPPYQNSGTVAQNRFNLLVGQFTQVFSTQDHPLVIFLDDLQWADSASLNLLNLLMGKSKTDYLLVLGAYRDNEVFSAHPLMLQLDELTQQGSSFQTLALASLSQNDINHLVADTLLCAPDIALPLSELVYQKTQGNPFFTTQFLQGLHSDQQITFDTEARYWQCDLTQVQQLALTDDVVMFMVGRLQTLPASTQEVLKIAACIGNQFDLDTLALVCEDNKEQIATDLWPALNDGLILSQSEDYKFFSNNNNDTDIRIKQDITVSYHFMHDRFQQAADALIPEEDKKEYHLKIGQLLYKKRIDQDQKISIFNIVNSLNQGINLIDDPCQRQQLAQLNLEAGQKAKASIAYTEAVSYFESGIKLLSDQGWKTQYVLILSLYSELVDVHYLRGDFEAVETISSSALEHVSVIADTLPIYIAQIASDQAQGKMLSGLELSLKVLKSLGIQMSAEISNDTIQKKLSQTLSEFQSRTIDEFIALPQTSDPQLLRTQDLLTLMVGYAYKSKPELLPIIICKQISLLLQHGNIPASASIYALFAMLLCGFQKFESGYFAGEVALAVMEAFPTKQFEMRVRNLIYAYVTPWKGLLKDCIPPLKNGFSIGIESGDIEYTAYGIQHYVQFLFFSGVNLATIDQENQTYSKVLETYRQDGILWSLQIFHQTALNLINLSEKPWELEGTIFRESECLQNLQENNFDVLIAALYINKLVVSYLFGKPLLGIGFAETANKSNSGLTGEFQISYLYYFRALCCLAILNQGTAEERTHSLSQVDNDIKKLDLFSHHAPMNFKHQVDLVKAERHRVLDQKLEAIDAYELAIAGAKENGYVQEEALGNELAAKFYLDWGKDKSATAYIQEAYGCYARWGAKAKTDDLEQRYTHLLQPILQPRSQSLNPLATLASLVDTNLSIHSSASVTSNRTNLNTSLDFAALLAGAQALSESLNLSELLEKLTQMILQNSGADSLVLLLPETDDSWHIRATAIPETTQLTNEPLVGNSNLPVQLIQYVQHTQEVLVVDDLDIDLPILDDYLQQHQPCSVLCLPIRYQGNLSGLLYLQNQSTAGVFTCDRITVLNFLCSQAAIALENARLFSKRLDIEAELQQLNAQLDQRVKERTQELSETLETLKSAQVSLIEAEKMAALGTLVAGVAHEINTPIGTSITVASTLADESEQFLQAAENGQLRRSTLNQYLEVVRQCTQLLNSNLSRAADLIQSFKQVAIDQSHQELRTFNLKAYVEEVVTSLQPQVKHSGHQLRVSGDEWITLTHNPGVVAQLITNLVTNSIKHAYAEGETGQLQIQIKQQDQRAFMTYSDDGCGIPPANLSKVYEPFFTTARHRGGTGLGLNIVYNIVTQSLQGTIQIDSQVGQGTTFTIAIPYKPDLKAR